jgi:DNA-directed RNA polymerase subunit RPC12/RpoP
MPDLEKYYRLNCKNCGQSTYGTFEEYLLEMSMADSQWRCKNCGNRDSSAWDDDYWESTQYINLYDDDDDEY